MRRLLGWRYLVVGLGLVMLLAGACTSGDGDGDGNGGGGDGEVQTGVGVTEEPCPGGSQDRGCIYLGVLSDLTEGPFAPLAVPITDGQKAFWDRVNADGGIGGEFDVDIETNTRDNKYRPEEHVAKYREIEPEILALAQSLGTPTTLAAIDLYRQDEVIASPASWWSGWAFEDNILESGYNYCVESQNGLDWASETFGAPETVMAVGYPGDYGGDSAAGVQAWAEANDVEFDAGTHIVQTAPNAVAGNQDAAVGAILGASPGVVVVATGPGELAEIIGKAVAQGFEGEFVGSVPTFNPAILASAAGPAILAKYHFVAPWGPWGSDTAAHDAMSEATGGEPPANDGYTFGWIWSYPIKALLEAAHENGDLTRAGLLEVADGLTVDYEGALPEVTFGGDPNDSLVRDAIIAQPDEEAPLGSSVLEDFFVGPTAEAFEFTEACSSAG